MKSPSTSKKYLKVAVCVDKSRNYCRGVMTGIADYVETYGPWLMFIDSQVQGAYRTDWLKDWKGNGVLLCVADPHVLTPLISSVPIVSLHNQRPQPHLSSVGNDNKAIGQLAAAHYLERHFKHFAFCGYPQNSWSLARENGFAEALQPLGFIPELFHSECPDTATEWDQVEIKMSAWISRLPKPIGLMACSDHFAQLVLAACQRADIAVPEEVAVMGVDNDESVFRLASPPLTSVIDNPRRIGFLGAQMLHDIMRKNAPSEIQTVLVPPVGITTRRSTDITAIEDRLVATVARFIREHAGEGLSVDGLPKKFGVSRSVLYRRFLDALGRSPHQEIQRIQMDRVKNLLMQTDLSLEKIAAMTGFEHPEYLNVAFKRATGLPPGRFRSQHLQR